jgi:hypothetical protein
MALGAEIPLKDAFGFYQFIELISILQKGRTLVWTIVSRQVVDDSGGGRIKPFRILDNQISPADHAVRIRIRHYRSNCRPRLAVGFDKRMCPTFGGKGMILHKRDDRGRGGENTRGSRSGRGG